MRIGPRHIPTVAARGLVGRTAVHGLPNGLGCCDARHLRRDRTDGCIGMSHRDRGKRGSQVSDRHPIVEG